MLPPQGQQQQVVVTAEQTTARDGQSKCLRTRCTDTKRPKKKTSCWTKSCTRPTRRPSDWQRDMRRRKHRPTTANGRQATSRMRCQVRIRHPRRQPNATGYHLDSTTRPRVARSTRLGNGLLRRMKRASGTVLHLVLFSRSLLAASRQVTCLAAVSGERSVSRSIYRIGYRVDHCIDHRVNSI